jgi:beta-lactamase class A
MPKVNQSTYRVNLIISLVISTVVIAVGSYLYGYHHSDVKFQQYLRDFKPLRKGGDLFKYINPLVGTDSPNSFTIGYHKDLQKDLLDTASEYKKKGLKDYSIYYRDLNSAVWFGINEEVEYFPASLLKITIALAVYKYGEDNLNYLDSKIEFTQAVHDIALSRKNEDTDLVVGNSYSVRELVTTMLIDSDNSARDLIMTTLPEKYITELYSYLNISEPSPQKNFRMSIDNYALLFRLLYSSTFVDEEHSEELLSILTHTNFPYGITRDLPSDIPIAHKFGVYNLPKDADGVELQQLHDCGIIYQLDRPYLLCVMTQGPEQAVLADFIAKVSRKVYKYSFNIQ